MALKDSFINLNKALRTTLQNVPAVVDTLERGFAEIGEDISTSADVKKATNNFETINGGLLSECKVALSPIQDLHGYSEPWVGGSRKNKLPLPIAETKNGVTLTHNADGSLTLTGTPSDITYFDFFAGNFDSAQYEGYIFRAYSTNTSWGPNDILFRISTASHSGLQDIFGNIDGAIANNGSGLYFAIRISNIFVIPSGGVTIYPMLRKSTETADFESYENICPISGHTQVDVDVSDGQTTQEQVTVNLGGTYYSGTLDVVSGVLTVDSAFIASYNGETLPSTWISDRDVYAVGTTPTTGAEVCYKLATPTPIQLSPTMVKALVGENHLSAPLDGQEIAEVEYKEIFTYSDVEIAIDNAIASVYPEAPAADGSYVLTLVKDGTSITRSWVSTEP